MDGDSIGKIILMAVLLVFSAFFSASETAFSTFNRIRMKNLAQGDNKRAKLVMKYEDRYDKFINSVLIGNNIVNIALSSIATIFFVDLLREYVEDAQSLGATVSTIVITVTVILFGEITPKVIAKSHADKVAMAFVMIIHLVIVILTPLSLVFTGWTKLLMKLFKQSEQDVVTEEELITIVDEAEEDGTIESDEGDLIRSAIEFNDVSAGDILTPRVDIFAISKDSTMEEIAESFTKSAYSRLPMYGEDLDDIVGILHEKDFFVAYHSKKNSVADYIHKPEYVSEHIKIADLLQVLKSKKTHMAVVVDEFGGTMGLVTMEDIIEELIGDVFDEHDEITNDYQELPDGSFIVKCSADLDDFFDKFDITVDDEEDMPQTVNGFIQKELESIPHVGDGFDYKNLKIEISNIGPKRVEEIHVTVIENEEEDAE